MTRYAIPRDRRDTPRDSAIVAKNATKSTNVTDVTDVTGTRAHMRTYKHTGAVRTNTALTRARRLSRLSRVSRHLCLRGVRTFPACHVACHVRAFPVTYTSKEKKERREGR